MRQATAAASASGIRLKIALLGYRSNPYQIMRYQGLVEVEGSSDGAQQLYRLLHEGFALAERYDRPPAKLERPSNAGMRCRTAKCS